MWESGKGGYAAGLSPTSGRLTLLNEHTAIPQKNNKREFEACQICPERSPAPAVAYRISYPTIVEASAEDRFRWPTVVRVVGGACPDDARRIRWLT